MNSNKRFLFSMILWASSLLDLVLLPRFVALGSPGPALRPHEDGRPYHPVFTLSPLHPFTLKQL